MASQNLLQPPDTFNFSKPGEWGKWKSHFQQYRIASGLSEKTQQQQVSTLLYCLGEGSEDVLETTGATEADKGEYNCIIHKFDEHFKVRRNVIFERATFNQRNQEVDESAEVYITTIHQMADRCEYGTMKDELVRDRLVVGIRDKALSQRLQMEEALTLTKDKTLIRQREAVKEQGQILRGARETTGQMDAVQDKYRHKRGPQQPNESITNVEDVAKSLIPYTSALQEMPPV